MEGKMGGGEEEDTWETEESLKRMGGLRIGSELMRVDFNHLTIE